MNPASSAWQPIETRSFRVVHKPSFNGSGLDYWLHTSGMGNGCVGGPEAGKYRTEAEAQAAGRSWVVTGKPDCVTRASERLGVARFAGRSAPLRAEPLRVSGLRRAAANARGGQ